MENSTIISLETAQLPNNILRADIYVKNAPAHFLGLAFELNIEGQTWVFQKYELGSVFKKPSELLVLATKRAEPNQRIVFGLGYKGKTLISRSKTTPDDGKMISFYLQTPTTRPQQSFGLGHQAPEGLSTNPLTFTFSQNIISIYEKGRKDIQNVVWTNKEIYLKPFTQQLLPKKAEIISQKISKPETKSPEKFMNQSERTQEAGKADLPSLLPGQSFLPIEKSTESMTTATGRDLSLFSANTFQPDQDLNQVYLVFVTIFVLFVITLTVTAFVFIFRKNKT